MFIQKIVATTKSGIVLVLAKISKLATGFLGYFVSLAFGSLAFLLKRTKFVKAHG